MNEQHTRQPEKNELLNSDSEHTSPSLEIAYKKDIDETELEATNLKEVFIEKFVKLRDELKRYQNEDEAEKTLNDFFVEMNLNFNATQDSVIDKLAETEESMSRLLYTDTRFSDIEIKNKRYVRNKIKEAIKSLDDLPLAERNEAKKRYARISMDVNGLKPINDFAGHDAGDVFLTAIVHKLHKIQFYYKNQGIELVPSSEGGDEFGMMVKKESGEITKDELEEISKMIEEEVSSINNQHEIVDFRLPAIKSKIANQMNINENDLRIPENFTFVPSIAIGYTRLDGSIESAIKEINEDKAFFELTDNEQKTERIHRIMKHWFKSSEDKMSKKKDSYKEKLKLSTDEEQKFQYFLIQRNEEARKLTKENQSLREKISLLQNEFDELKQTIKEFKITHEKLAKLANKAEIYKTDAKLLHKLATEYDSLITQMSEFVGRPLSKDEQKKYEKISRRARELKIIRESHNHYV